MRDFRTTGVVLRITAEWFTSELKKQFADALRSLIFREYSIAPQDVDVAATNIALIQGGQRLGVSDAIAIFDVTYGSLRLTEPVFTDLGDLLTRLSRAADLVGEKAEAPVPKEFLNRLLVWLEGLPPLSVPIEDAEKIPQDGWLRVLKPGSRVGRRDSKGVLSEIEILEPFFMSPLEGQPAMLYYRYRPASASEGILASSFTITSEKTIQRIGEDRDEILWNPSTGEYRDDDGEGTEN